MSKKGKLLERFEGLPKDFTWSELRTLLKQLGYEEEEGDGSRICFIGAENKKIFLHKPHPGNIIKHYALKKTLENLKEHGKI